jgi:large subunit ribosomal protein L27Ae
MRSFHLKRGIKYTPTINVDRLWSLLPEGEYEKAKNGSELTPVLDVTKLVSSRNHRNVN